MKTAGLLWPVIGRSGMDYYVPEIMVTRKWQNQILANALKRADRVSAGAAAPVRASARRDPTAGAGRFYYGVRAVYDPEI